MQFFISFSNCLYSLPHPYRKFGCVAVSYSFTLASLLLVIASPNPVRSRLQMLLACVQTIQLLLLFRFYCFHLRWLATTSSTIRLMLLLSSWSFHQNLSVGLPCVDHSSWWSSSGLSIFVVKYYRSSTLHAMRQTLANRGLFTSPPFYLISFWSC